MNSASQFLKHIVYAVVLVSSLCNSCNTKLETSSQNSQLTQYYSKKNWSFPIEISLDSLQYPESTDNKLAFNKDSLKKLFLNWYYSDSIFRKYDSTVVISRVSIKTTKQLKPLISCFVDFYSPGEIKDGAVAPVEGHAIIENKFLRQREIAYLTLENSKLIFLHWQN